MFASLIPRYQRTRTSTAARCSKIVIRWNKVSKKKKFTGSSSLAVYKLESACVS